MLSDYEMVEALEFGIKMLTEDAQNNIAAMQNEITNIQNACKHDYKIDTEYKEYYVCTKCKHTVICRI